MKIATLKSILSKKILFLLSKQSIATALDTMSELSISSIVVVDDANRPIGIFTEHDALRIVSEGIDIDGAIEGVMSVTPFCVVETMLLHDGYMLMEEKKFRHLVVIDESGSFAGVVTEGDFLRHIGFEHLTNFKMVSEVMSDTPLIVNRFMKLTEAASLMRERHCDYAVVLEDSHPIGMITERDIVHRCAHVVGAHDESVEDIIQRDVVMIDKSIPLHEAASLMEKHGVHQLIVVDVHKELIGLLSRHNVLHAVHGAYFEFLIGVIDKKNSTIDIINELNKKLETLANYDPLTGLSNRTFLSSHLHALIEKSKRHKVKIALLMFDLDRFKDVNDSFGHGAGDELLVQVAARFQSRLREGDIVGRLGGDEFVVVLEHLGRVEDAGRIAEEMIKVLTEPYRLSSGIVEVHVGASAGISLFPEHGSNASELFQYADAALYRAKAEGRGTYRYYTDALTASARRRIECEMKLRRAIASKEFEVYYQPQVHIATGRIVGAEALLRWNCPVRGRVSPMDFIPMAEDTGLIGEIGEWVLNETCRQGKIWLDSGHRLTLAVNLSAHQVRHQDILLMVDNALSVSGYSADRLELELTESALMQHEEETVGMLHSLRARGIRIAIDDFGTGYSSLSYLKRFPIDVLKIDKSFVDDVPFEKDDMAIVTAIIAMGNALGFQVLAEGVEKSEQLEFLRERGCGFYQGYFKSVPLSAAEFEKLLL